MERTDWLEIGRIVGAQGLRGEVRVYPNSDFPQRFLEPGTRWLRRPNRTEVEPVELVQGRFLEGKGLYVVQFEQVTNRDQAEALRQSVLLVSASDRPPLEPGEFYVGDLVGLAVYLQGSDTQVGVVVDLYAAGNDLLEIQLLPEIASTPASVSPDSQVIPEKMTAENPDQPTAPSRKSKRRAKQAASHPPTVLIPFVEEIVPIVDLEAGRIEINPPTGLLTP